MEHYVTLFDSLFLPQGLALHMSMERHVKDYTLWILCVDDETHEVLAKLNLPNVRLLQLSKLETDELLRVKPTRAKREYCWTLTPFAPRFVFEADGSVERVTYLDADLWFRKHPAPIFEEFEETGKQVLITDHAYAPEYDLSATCGQYCVQFITFSQKRGEVVRKWWEERCLEWCYARHEKGRFGDQMYLDDWPERFNTLVHVLRQQHLTVAPWNVTRFPYSGAIIYHFHGLKIEEDQVTLNNAFPLPKPVVNYIYKPYIKDLTDIRQRLMALGYSFRNQQSPFTITGLLKSMVRGVYQNIWRLKTKRTIRLG